MNLEHFTPAQAKRILLHGSWRRCCLCHARGQVRLVRVTNWWLLRANQVMWVCGTCLNQGDYLRALNEDSPNS